MIGAFGGVGVAEVCGVDPGRFSAFAGRAGAAARGAGREAGAPIGTSGMRGAEGGSGRASGFGITGMALAGPPGGAPGATADGGAGGGEVGRPGSGRGGCTVAVGDAGGIGALTAGVGRRAGLNGGTLAGVGLRGIPAGGVRRAGAAGAAGRGSAGRSIIAAAPNDAPVRAADPDKLAASCGVAKSSVQLRVAVIGMMPPHTEHRARTPGPGTRAGSTRNTDWHSGHETFMTRRPG